VAMLHAAQVGQGGAGVSSTARPARPA
jgi:hypothetical protein